MLTLCSDPDSTVAVVTMSESILQRVAQRDASAMQDCVRRYSALVWSLARRSIAIPTDAEDAVQEIFVEVWRCADRFDPNVAPEATFVAMIARRRLIDRQRRVQRTPKFEALPEPAALPAEQKVDMVEASDQAAKITEAFATLRQEQREVLEMALIQGYSQREIAEHKGMPLGTVKSLARRGLIKVRSMLKVNPDFEGVES